MIMQSSSYYQEYDTCQDSSMKRQQRRPSMIYERRTSLSPVPTFNDFTFPTTTPTSLVEMVEEVACMFTSPLKASRRRSISLSMNDLCELTGDSSFESFGESSCVDSPFVSLPKDTRHTNNNSNTKIVSLPKDMHNNNNNNNNYNDTRTWTSSTLANQIHILRRKSISVMPTPLCNDKDKTVGYSKEIIDVDAANDDFFHGHEKASDIQPFGPLSLVMASALDQSLFDPSNPLNLANAKDYQVRLKELVGRMATSERSRSKVAKLKMSLMHHDEKELFKRKLDATGLNTTKSEATRKLLFRAQFLTAKASGTGTGTGTRSQMNGTFSSCNTKPISHAVIKGARRKNARRRDSAIYGQSAARHASMDATANFDEADPSTPRPSGMNMITNKHTMNANPLMVARRLSRRRSSLSIQSFQMQFFPDSV